MKHLYCKYLVLLAALGSVSCSAFNKLLKSDDNDKKYTRAIEYYNEGKYDKCALLMESLNQIFAGTERADTLAYYYGAALYKDGDFVTSGKVFDAFRRTYSRSPFVEDAEYMYAKGLYYSSPSSRRDQTTTSQAIVAIDEYLNRYPNSSKKESLQECINDLQQRIYDKAMENAKLYYDIGYYNSAIVALRNAINTYPESNHRELLSYLIVRSHYLYAKNSVETKQRQRYMDMQDAYYSFVAEYPESAYRKEADKMQADSKKFLDKFSAKEAAKEKAKETAEAHKKAKSGKHAIDDVDPDNAPELKPVQSQKISPDGILNPRKLRKSSELKLENSTIQNGTQKK